MDFSPPALAALRSAMPVIGGPYHPMTQGKIERYHRSMKNRILLENYYLPGQLEHSVEEFVEYYTNSRCHESPDNLMPADVYFGAVRPFSIGGKRSNENHQTKTPASAGNRSLNLQTR